MTLNQEDKHLCTHKGQRESEEKADDDQDKQSDDTDLQDVQVEERQQFEHESEHSCHDPPQIMSTLSPQISSDHLATEIVSHLTIKYYQTLLFILNVTSITC